MKPKPEKDNTPKPPSQLDALLAIPKDQNEPKLDEIAKGINRTQTKWRDDLSVPEGDAIKTYSGSTYREINSSLRNQTDLDTDVRSIVNGLDRCLARSVIPHDMTIFRGIDDDHYIETAIQNGGTSFVDRGFTSTSINPRTAVNFASKPSTPDAAILEIRVKKGQKGGFLNSDLSQVGEEQEILLPRNGRYVIVGKGRKEVDTNYGKKEVDTYVLEYDDSYIPKPKKGKGIGLPVTTLDLEPLVTTGNRTTHSDEGSTKPRYVGKTSASHEHIESQSAADSIYEVMGIRVPRHVVIDKGATLDALPTKLSEFIPGKPIEPYPPASVQKELRKGFAVDALLGNRVAMDNSMSKDGMGNFWKAHVVLDSTNRPYRTHTSASLGFHEDGTRKSKEDWGAEVTELRTMRKGVKGTSTDGVYGSITDTEVRKQIKELAKKRKEILAAAPTEEDRKILAARLDYMEKW